MAWPRSTVMSWPRPVRIRHSFAAITDCWASATAAAPPMRMLLGISGSRLRKVMVPPLSSGVKPSGARMSRSSACGSNASSVARLWTALSIASRSSCGSVVSMVGLPSGGEQRGRDVDVAGAEEFAEGLADLVEGQVRRAGRREVAAQHEGNTVQVRLFVAFDGHFVRAAEEVAETVGRQERGQPRPG